jgi:hypothetical protein
VPRMINSSAVLPKRFDHTHILPTSTRANSSRQTAGHADDHLPEVIRLARALALDAITRTAWSGPRFFALRAAGDSAHAAGAGAAMGG